MPVARRREALVFRIGQRVVYFGGTRIQHCPRNALCPFPGVAGRGAVLDLRTGVWRPMARPPAYTSGCCGNEGQQAASTGRRVVVLSSQSPARLSAYDPVKNSWRQFPAPPHPLQGDDFLAPIGRYVYANPQDDARGGTPLQRLDLTTGKWSTLPVSRYRARLSIRRLFETPAGLVVVGGTPHGRSGSSDQTRAELLTPGGWRRFSDPQLDMVGYQWRWTGSRLVAPFGPRGRSAALDPRTGAWSRLTTQPGRSGDGAWDVGTAAAGTLISEGGRVYDDAHESFTSLTPPTPKVGRRAASSAWIGNRLLVIDETSQAWLSPAVG